MSRGAVSLLLLAGWMLVAGCTAGPVLAPPPTQILVPSTATPEPLPPTPTAIVEADVAPPLAVGGTPEQVVIPAAAQVMVGLVIEDLAEQLAVSSTAIGLRAVQEVVWSGEGLGCALTDQDDDTEAATDGGDEATINGYRITLAYQDDVYHYHTDAQASFTQCSAAGVIPDGEPVIIDTLLGSMVDVARRDLASRLDLPLRRVFVVTAAPVVWPDGSLGCVLADQEYEATPVSGYRIVLRAGPEEYAYHGDYRQVRFCPADAVRLPDNLAPTPQPNVTPTLDSGE